MAGLRMSDRVLIDTDVLIDVSRGIVVTGYPLLSKNQSDYRFIQGINLLPFNQ